MARKNKWSLIAGIFCMVVSAGVLQAAGITYSDQAKRIKAGVLVQPRGPLDPANRPDPYLFYVLDQRQDIKPAGWELYNPYAPSNVTSRIYSRWAGRYEVGQNVRKDMGCYWEVPTDMSPDTLAEYDVLFLSSYGSLTFDRKEKEALRKFVDNGGVLWIERRGTSSPIFMTNFFIEGIELMNTASPAVPSQVHNNARHHSLVNRPFPLLWNDIVKLGPGRSDDGKGWIELSASAYRYMIPIVVRDGIAVITAAQYGSGYVLVTAESIGLAVSDPLGTAGVTGKYEGILMASQPEDLKFAYNIISWGSEHTTAQKSARHTGYSYSEIGMLPLSLLWEFRHGSLSPNTSAPAIINDMVFYVSNINGSYFLHAFDLSPVRDRDGDGDPDDGIPDYSQGYPYDELWRKPLGGPASSPTVAYVPNFPGSGAELVPAVFVMTKAGSVLGFDASLPDPPEQQFFNDPGHAPVGFPDICECIPSPTYVDGTLYVTDGHGILRAQRLFPPGGIWSRPSDLSTPRGPGHSPTVGYFYDSTTGVTELVAYAARAMLPNVTQGGISCYPIRVVNEILTPVNPTASPGLFRTRHPQAQIVLDTLNVYWTLDGVSTTYVMQNGMGHVDVLPNGHLQIDAVAFSAIPEGAVIIADYELDYLYATTLISRQEIAPHVGFGAGVPQNVGHISAPAASKKDILYYADDWSSFYAVKESGRGDPPLAIKWRWCAQDEAASAFLGLSSGTPLEPVGSPALGDDTVYFAANTGDQGYLLAFRADPAVSIRLGTPLKQGTRVVVRQWDTINSPAGGGTETEPAEYTGTVVGDSDKIPPNTMFLVDYDTGTISFLNLRNARDRGRIMTLSQNMTVVYTPRPYNEDDIVEETEVPIGAFDANQKISNLIGFSRLQNRVTGGPLRITSAPMITGSVLYVGCEDGILASVDLSEALPKNGTDATKQQQLVLDLSPTNSAIRAAVAGSHGMLAVSTPAGLGIYHSPVTLVTDSNRLVELNSSGDLMWSLDSTSTYTTTTYGGDLNKPIYGAVKIPFNRPAVARRAPVGGYVVADTGNNRIVHVDKSGMVMWQVMDFADPNELLPAGSSLTLNKPTDVSMWVSYDAGITYPVYNYLIADSGNFRVLEIAAVYDDSPDVQSYVNRLRQTTRTVSEGKQYRFATARFVYTPAGAKLVCSVMNSDDQGSLDGIAGSLVEVDWTTGAVGRVISGLPIDSSPPMRRLSNPRFFNRQYISSTEYYDVVIDSLGIHVLRSASGVPQGVRSFYAGDNTDPALIPLAASYAQVMPNGRILVTNRATGTVAGGSFLGEVFELEPHPTDAGRYRRVSGSSLNRNIRQPSSAERLIQ